MRLSRRSIGVLIAAGMLLVGLAPGASAAAEDSLLDRLNGARRNAGLPELVSHWDLADDAEAHSAAMRAADDLYHNPNLAGVTTGWLRLGENVGVGPTVRSIHNAFMQSPPHRGNILGDFTHVGIGAVRASEDKLWVTVVFMKARGGATTTTTTAPPVTTTAAPTTTTTTPPVTTAPPATTTPPATVAPPPTAVPVTTLPPVVEPERPADPPPGTQHVVRLRFQPQPI